MAIDDVDDPCPRPGCGLPYSHVATTAKTFQQKLTNLTAAKQCYIPRLAGDQAVVTIVYHTYEDIASATWDKPRWAQDHPACAEKREIEPDAGADPSHPRDLSGDHEAVFEIIREASRQDNSILMADLKPAAREHGIERDDLHAILVNLIYHEFIVENEDSVFKVPGEVVL